MKSSNRDESSSENVGTRIATTVRVARLTPRMAFFEAFEALQPYLRAGDAEVAVVSVDPAGLVHLVTLQDGESLTVGRHTACSLQLKAESAPLRHLVALATRDPANGQATVRLWDLNTQQPFLLEDGRVASAVVAHGLLYASVGDMVLLFVPLQRPGGQPWPRTAEEAWLAMPKREIVDVQAVEPERPARLVEDDGRSWHSQVRMVRPLLLLEDQERPEEAWGELRLRTKSASTPCLLSASRLSRGVLLGRYKRCQFALDDENISRVHLLLVRIGGEVWALDTASTNGLTLDGEEVHAVRLRDGDVLTLTSGVELQWRRRSVPSA